MVEDYFLDFEIRTAQFLGQPNVANRIIDALSKLPKKYSPTKCVGSDYKKKPFSLNDPDNFIAMVPGEYAYEGHVSLYKANNIFELTVFWAKGDVEWFNSSPAKRFNSIVISISNAEKVLSNKDDFSLIKMIWLELCDKFSAAFAYCSLDQHIGTRPRGEGFCLPRLHWLSYFGNGYTQEFNLKEREKLNGANLEIRDNDTSLISIDSSPFDLTDPCDDEWNVIEQLGVEYFWGYIKDDWRKPKGKYKMPDFNWDTVLIKNKT